MRVNVNDVLAPVEQHIALAMFVLGWFLGAVVGFPWYAVATIGALVAFRHRRHEATHRDRLIIELQNAMSDARVAHQILGDKLPQWVTFPQVERTAWLNALVEQLWPSIATALSGSLLQSLNPLLETYMPTFLSKLCLSDINLGTVPVRILGVHGLTETGNTSVLDLNIAWAGAPTIRLLASAVRVIDVEALVEDFTLKGLLRVTLGPHCDCWPCFGAMAFSFVGTPTIDFKLTALRMPLDAIPGFAAWLEGFIRDSLFYFMVFPRRYEQCIVADSHLQNAIAVPVATAVVYVDSASGLPKRMFQSLDTHVVGTMTSSLKESETVVVRDNANPSYEKRMTFTVMGSPDERLLFTVHDRYNVVGKVDFFTSRLLGKDGVQEFNNRIVSSDASKNVGKLKVTVEMAPLVPYAAAPRRLLDSTKQQPGVILINVVSAARLSQVALFGALSNVLKVGRSSSNYYVKASVGRLSVRTWTSAHTRDPVYNWHDHVDFRDVRSDSVEFTVCTQEVAMDHTLAKASVLLSDVAAAHGKLRTVLHLEPEGELTVELAILMRVTVDDGTEPSSP
jgi:hypothetical protein